MPNGCEAVSRPGRRTSTSAQDAPSAAFQQAKDDLLFPPDMRKDTQDPARGTTFYEMPMLRIRPRCKRAEGAEVIDFAGLD